MQTRPKLFPLMQAKWYRLRRWIAATGLRPCLLCVCPDKCGCVSNTYTLQPAYLQAPVTVRGGSSDIDVFRQVFVDREYVCLDAMPEVNLVVDCGANVGYSSAYFLSLHPTCRVIAIEPDPGNYALLQQNLEPYGARAEAVQAGIWSHPADLVVVSDYRDGREWSRQVRECRPGEAPEVRGLDLGAILSQSGHPRISLLKIDIEGAEAIVFSNGYEAWLDKVDAIAIELHDDVAFGDAGQIFDRAMQGQGFELSHRGELTLCQRPRDR